MSEMTSLSGTKPQKYHLLFCVKTNANCLIILNSVWQTKGRGKEWRNNEGRQGERALGDTQNIQEASWLYNIRSCLPYSARSNASGVSWKHKSTEIIPHILLEISRINELYVCVCGLYYDNLVL